MKSNTMFLVILSATIITVSGIYALGITTNAVAHEDKNWKTFISPEYKFRIDYPSDLKAHNYLSDSKIPSVFFFNFKSGATSEPSNLYIHQNNMSLQEFVDRDLVNGLEKPKILEGPTPITIADGNPGLSYSTTNSLGAMYKQAIFTHGNHIYEFSYTVNKENFNELNYNHMVESIKFLD
jgi:hypothetical protein